MNSDLKFKDAVMITGGAGFIGSHVVRLFVNKYPKTLVVNYDLLTYCGNLENLRDIEDKPNYRFVKGDICDAAKVRETMERYGIKGIIHLAAESHVDRSITDPLKFARVNVMGTLNLLETARQIWSAADPEMKHNLFYQISTDEVFGALEMTCPEGKPAPYYTGDKPHLAFGDEYFCESTPYTPHSPYSAAKASADHFVRAYHDTYGMPVVISNCSNNYGPNQFPEKLIPLFVNNIVHEKPLPVYGEGLNVRDWLYVVDHARAIDLIYHTRPVGKTYCIGGFNECRNIDMIRLLIRITDRLLGRPEGYSEKLITHVTDRKGHDLRYAIDSRLLAKELGWKPSLQFEEGIEKTVKWYLDNQQWTDRITSGEYEKYYEEMYGKREKL